MLFIPAILSYHEQGSCTPTERVCMQMLLLLLLFSQISSACSPFSSSVNILLCVLLREEFPLSHYTWNGWYFIIPTPGAFIVLRTEHVCIHTGPLDLLVVVVVFVIHIWKRGTRNSIHNAEHDSHDNDNLTEEKERASERAHPASFKQQHQLTEKAIDVVNIKVCWR